MSELGDSRLDVNFDDVYDFETVPDSEEVQLRVTSAEIYRKEGGTRANLHLVFEVLDNPKASDIHLYMGIPNRDEDAKTANRLKLRLKAFYDAAEADPRGAVGELVGSTLWVIVGEEEDPQYGKRNFIRKFQATR